MFEFLQTELEKAIWKDMNMKDNEKGKKKKKRENEDEEKDKRKKKIKNKEKNEIKTDSKTDIKELYLQRHISLRVNNNRGDIGKDKDRIQSWNKEQMNYQIMQEQIKKKLDKDKTKANENIINRGREGTQTEQIFAIRHSSSSSSSFSTSESHSPQRQQMILSMQQQQQQCEGEGQIIQISHILKHLLFKSRNKVALQTIFMNTNFIEFNIAFITTTLSMQQIKPSYLLPLYYLSQCNVRNEQSIEIELEEEREEVEERNQKKRQDIRQPNIMRTLYEKGVIQTMANLLEIKTQAKKEKKEKRKTKEQQNEKEKNIWVHLYKMNH
ncbi:MAG: hypothetical protein EZS28_034508 [Streblomastix strix]|uniref:Uncharacterized protein n=1 Tax=Streblomastix strix TaxID=222440 RepID=A0A5J4UJX0_9EUKA|nr:MAG: hypothetical protein EZS28_034508 [Streblomastix strix]